MIHRSIATLLFIIQSVYSQTPEITSWVLNPNGETGYKGYITNVQSVNYTSTDAYVACTCIPGYDIGPWQNNPNIPVPQNFTFKITRAPKKNTGTPVATSLGHTGVWTNGVSIFNAKDGMSYNNQGVWNRDALFWEGISFDSCLGHAAPNGEYHHHVNPRCLYNDGDSSHHSPIIGFAFDGFPIYGAYGYTNTNGTGAIKRMRSSFVKSTATTRANGPAVSTQYPIGCFIEDFSFVDGSGDLDNHNGRFCVTPEYPSGTYAYFVTIDDALNPVYPYTPGPTYYGVVQTGNTGPGSGHNTVPANAQKYTPSSATPTITISASGQSTVCQWTRLQFNATATKGGSLPTYQWLKNGKAVGTNSAVYVDSLWQDRDSVQCRLTSSDSTASPLTVTSAAVVLRVSASVTPTVTINPPTSTEFCEGTTLSLTAKTVNAGTSPTFRWMLNGQSISTSPTLVISNLKNDDLLAVELTSNAVCAQPAVIQSDALKFVVHALPPVPVVTQVDRELHSSALSGNQWYLDGNIIVGATSQVYVVSMNGTYTVRVTDPNGCGALSNAVLIQSMNVGDESSAASLRVQPNPVGDACVLHTDEALIDAQLIVSDALGRECLRLEQGHIAAGSSLSIPTTSLPYSGYYTLRVQHNGGVHVLRLLKN